MTINTKEIAAQINDALQANRDNNPRAKVRLLHPGERDYQAILDAAIAKATPDETLLFLREHADIVANSYPGHAEGDALTLLLDIHTGRIVSLVCGRIPAPKRPHGKGDLLTVRLRSEGQALGRSVL